MEDWARRTRHRLIACTFSLANNELMLTSHVGAAAPETPDTLLQQLKAPGRMFIPVGKMEQYIYQYDKDLEGKVHRTTLFGVRVSPFLLLCSLSLVVCSIDRFTRTTWILTPPPVMASV